jgi:hypothetical protein
MAEQRPHSSLRQQARDLAAEAHAALPAELTNGTPRARNRRYAEDVLEYDESKFIFGPCFVTEDPSGAPGSWAVALECDVRTYYDVGDLAAAGKGDGEHPSRHMEEQRYVGIEVVDMQALQDSPDRFVLKTDLLTRIAVQGEDGRVASEIEVPAGLSPSIVEGIVAEQRLCLDWLRVAFGGGSGGGAPAGAGGPVA